MNDITLSGLLNLFALFGAQSKLPKEEAMAKVTEYLNRFYGVRNVSSYLNLYTDLRDFYDDDPEIDFEMMVDGVCGKLRSQVRADEKMPTLMRLMEFCSTMGADSSNPLFSRVSQQFEISDDVFTELLNFLSAKESEKVLVIDLPEDYGKLKTLYLEKNGKLYFSYSGSRSLWYNDVAVLPDVFQVWEQSGIIKSNHFPPFYFSSIIARYSHWTQEKSVELCGRDINFRFEQGGDNGMHNLSFTLRSGELVAIMGGSGVGKSTLLSLLNGNLLPQSGSITINGHDIKEPEAKKMIGFVPQDDLLIEELTVYQNLWYTARFCFASMPDNELDERVMDVLTQLGLDQARDLKVGSPVNKYISGGQRKRLNIALELIREPAILFLDEPTSGLSSTDTEKVINLLKEQTNKGRLIVVNIHQPSSDVYKLFDRLWLLDKGGYPVYDGNPIEAVSYFKRAADYADFSSSTCPTCGNVNPEIVLNIIDEKKIDSNGLLSDERKFTPKQWHEMYLQNRPEMPQVEKTDIPPSDQKRPGVFKQFLIFFRRNVSTKLTNLQYIFVTLLEAPVLAAICAFLTKYTPDSGIYSIMDNKNLPSYLFMAIIVAIFLGMSGSAEEIIRDRALLKREKFLSLSYKSYIASKIVYMAVVCLVQTLLFIMVGNSIVGIGGMFWIWWLILFASAFLSALIGLMLSQNMNSVVAIYISIPLLLIPQILLCGLVVSFEDLNSKSETGNVPVIGDIIPSRWSYEALAVASYSMNPYEAPFYRQDRQRYEALYYDQSFAYELESRVENIRSEQEQGREVNPQHRAVLESELPRLSQVTGIGEYSGDWSYDSLIEYISSARKVLSKRCNKTTLALDKEINAFINEHGKDELVSRKQANYNLQLENLVLNRNTDHIYSVVGSHIVPRSGYIFLTPRSHNGRAPFYSGVKVVGSREIDTVWFNLGVLLVMCLLAGICLFLDFPGKFIRKEHN